VDVTGFEPATPCFQSRPCKNTNSFVWCRLHGKSAKFSLFDNVPSCPESKLVAEPTIRQSYFGFCSPRVVSQTRLPLGPAIRPFTRVPELLGLKEVNDAS
jgi:hypothetical protein